MLFRVWGLIDGVAFDQTFESVAEWKAERRAVEAHTSVRVMGMASVQVTP